MHSSLKSILITGATSGIGKYATKILSDRGWIVWAGYRSEQAKTELSKINPKLVHPIRIDVTSVRSIEKARATIVKSGIPLNVLCNNAGVAFGAPIELLDIPETQKAFDVDFFGVIRMIQAFLPLLRQTSGRIVNISSVSGLVGIPFQVPTPAAKFAVEGMSDALRREIEGQNVKVTIIEPVLIQTEIWEKSIKLSHRLLKNKQTTLRLYKQATDKLVSLFENHTQLLMPLSYMEKPLIHAVESKHPKKRYLVYRWSALLELLIKFLPEKFVDWLFRKVLFS